MQDMAVGCVKVKCLSAVSRQKYPSPLDSCIAVHLYCSNEGCPQVRLDCTLADSAAGQNSPSIFSLGSEAFYFSESRLTGRSALGRASIASTHLYIAKQVSEVEF